MNWTRLMVIAVLAIAAPAWAQTPHQPLWESPLQGYEIAALEDIDGDGLKDLFVFGSWPNGFSYRVYKAGVPASATSLLEFRAINVPAFAFGSTVGNVVGGAGQDLVLAETSEGGPWLWPDFRTSEWDFREPDYVGPIALPDPGGFVSTWGLERYRGLDFNQDGFDDFTAEDTLFLGSESGPIVAEAVDVSSFDHVATELMPDINGDGYPDVVTTLETYPPSIEICFGGPGADLLTDLQLVFDSGEASPIGGIAHLDDFDGDGEPDLAVGMRQSFAQSEYTRYKNIWIYRGGAALDDQADLIIHHPSEEGWYTGYGVDIGDINGDGYEDFAISEYSQTVFFFHGGPGADAIPDAWIHDTENNPRNELFAIGDWDGDGREEIQFDDLVYSPQIIDINEDGIHDFDQLELFGDCDGDGYPDPFELLMNWEPDCDENGLIDDCEIAANPALDCDENGNLDVCFLKPSTDCNANLMLDDCEMTQTNNWIDCDGNGDLDLCEISADPSLDLDASGRIDKCEEPTSIYLSFDSMGLSTHLRTGEPVVADIFVVFDSEPGFDRSGVSELRIGLWPPDGVVAVDSETLLPGAVDASVFDRTIHLYLFEPLPEEGPVVLSRVQFEISGDALDARVSLTSAPVGYNPPDAPVWIDINSMFHWFGEFRSVFINRTFADCNRNERDDEMDILTGDSEDLDLDGMPDECAHLVAAPTTPPAPRSLRVSVRPNPFNPRTVLEFDLTRSGRIDLEIFDATGRRVRVLASEPMDAGTHSRSWDGRDASGREVSSGVYFYRLRTSDGNVRGKMALIR